MGAPAYRQIIRFGPSYSNRWGARIRNIFWHTEEGDSTAEELAAYCNNPNTGASYHNLIRDGIVVAIVDTDFASWSVLDANPSSINYCFAGSRASWSRDQWMRRADDIRIAVWLSLEDCRKYTIAAEIIADPYRRGDGIADHNYVTQVLGIGSHTDVGPHFPWDFAKQVLREYLSGTPTPPNPVPNAIDEMARAATWLGAKHGGEQSTPDGRGKFAEYDHGYIYWTPQTGARPIPTHLFETYAQLGWEAGPLGYPIAYHTVLPDGDVQAFERGVLYRKYGKPGFYVTGLIGDRWARMGYENSRFGWPTSNEIRHSDGSVEQQFEHGHIVWSPDGVPALITADGPDTVVPDRR